MLSISVLISIATAPINILVDMLFQDIILAPLADEHKLNMQARLESEGGAGRRLPADTTSADPSLLPVPSSRLSRMMSRVMQCFTVEDTAGSRVLPPDVVMSRASTFMILKDDFDKDSSTSTSMRRATRVLRQWQSVGSGDGHDHDQIQLDLAERGEAVGSGEGSLFDCFCVGLDEHGKKLSEEAKSEFMTSWGLRVGHDVGCDRDSSGVFVDDHMVKSGVTAVSSSRRGGWCGGANSATSRRQVLSAAIDQTAQEARDKIKKLTLATDAHVGLEIMHLFIVDLLG